MSAGDDLARNARQDAQDSRHDVRCPNCGRYVPAESDGFYDRCWPYDDGAQVVQYCDENCCDEKRKKDAETFAARHVPRGTRQA